MTSSKREPTLSKMEDGHILGIGFVFGGGLFLLTSLAGAILFYYSARAWRNERKSKQTANDSASSRQ